MATKVLQCLESMHTNVLGEEISPRTAHIALKSPSKYIWRDKAGRKKEVIIISSECQTYAEFEYSVIVLMEDLEEMKKQAQEFFEQAV